jgi:hypothetical protein
VAEIAAVADTRPAAAEDCGVGVGDFVSIMSVDASLMELLAVAVDSTSVSDSDSEVLGGGLLAVVVSSGSSSEVVGGGLLAVVVGVRVSSGSSSSSVVVGRAAVRGGGSLIGV